MYGISHHPLVRHFALIIAVLIIFPCGFAAPAAHGQGFAEITSVVVLPMQDATGYGADLVAEKATDAVVMALEDSDEFRVEPKRNVAAAVAESGLVLPLMDTQQVRIGKELEAEKVVAGTIYELKVDPRTGRCLVQLEIRMMDVALGYILDGALEEVETRPIAGWQGEDVSVVNEALRQVAEQAVREMLRQRVPRGNVDAVDTLGVIKLNLGLNNGVYDGQRLLVIRPDWNPDLQAVKVRVVGEVQVYDVQPRLSKAKAVGDSQWARTDDKVYALYARAEVARERQRRRSWTQTVRLGAAVAMLLGVWAIGTSKGTTQAPGVDAQLGQTSVGSPPFIRVNMHRGWIPDTAQVHAWFIYRGQTRGFLASDQYFVAATLESGMDYYDDEPEFSLDHTFSKSFPYIDRSGDQEDGSIDGTVSDPALVPGTTYFYRVQRVVDPIQPVIPIANQVQPAEGSWTVDPGDAVGDPSRATDPVTYFDPAIPNSPSNNSTNENPSDVTFEWTPSVGADQYRVEVYDNPGLSGHPVYQSRPISWTGQTVLTHPATGYRFGDNTTYWWVVGNSKLGEPPPISYLSGQRREGWIYTTPFTFTTVEGPPEPWGIRGQSDRPSRPATRRGRWHERARGFGPAGP